MKRLFILLSSALLITCLTSNVFAQEKFMEDGVYSTDKVNPSRILVSTFCRFKCCFESVGAIFCHMVHKEESIYINIVL